MHSCKQAVPQPAGFPIFLPYHFGCRRRAALQYQRHVSGQPQLHRSPQAQQRCLQVCHLVASSCRQLGAALPKDTTCNQQAGKADRAEQQP